MGPTQLIETGGTIVAVSTPAGTGGISVVRMSGPDAVDILSKAWKGSAPSSFKTHTAHLGWISDEEGKDIDQVVATFFKAPSSYTGEDVVELSCHGSQWVQRAIVERLTECGARVASAGEFTRRAFVNGKIDLAQADGIADMIASTSKASARLASTQMRGEFSSGLAQLRQQLVDLGVLLELELDFSEEDVEFADRAKLIDTADLLLEKVRRLSDSYKAGRAFKSGVPVVIAGIPNAGKSTLLNALAGEEKAIVTDIPGTTRDSIEELIEISGILFRIADTAGLRQSSDIVEQIGVERALKKISDAAIIIFLIDPGQPLESQIESLKKIENEVESPVFSVLSKADIEERGEIPDYNLEPDIEISAKNGKGLDELKKLLVEKATSEFNPNRELIVTNLRHYEALKSAIKPLERLREGLENNISADFLVQDLREGERLIGEITGEITSEEILHRVFERYCIGK